MINEDKHLNKAIDLVQTDVGILEIETEQSEEGVKLNLLIDTPDGKKHLISSTKVTNSGLIDSELFSVGHNGPTCKFNSAIDLETYVENDIRNTILFEKYNE